MQNANCDMQNAGRILHDGNGVTSLPVGDSQRSANLHSA
jgi:hypothetical protein